MRMVEADDVEAASPRFPPRVNVSLRIDQKSVGVAREVAGSPGDGDDVAGSEQHAAALSRRRLACVGDDGVKRGPSHDHNASTTLAMPMPPPMHNAATP